MKVSKDFDYLGLIKYLLQSLKVKDILQQVLGSEECKYMRTFALCTSSSWSGLSKKHSKQYGWLLLPLVVPSSLELKVKPCCWRLHIHQIHGPETPPPSSSRDEILLHENWISAYQKESCKFLKEGGSQQSHSVLTHINYN